MTRKWLCRERMRFYKLKPRHRPLTGVGMRRRCRSSNQLLEVLEVCLDIKRKKGGDHCGIIDYDAQLPAPAKRTRTLDRAADFTYRLPRTQGCMQLEDQSRVQPRLVGGRKRIVASAAILLDYECRCRGSVAGRSKTASCERVWMNIIARHDIPPYLKHGLL